MLDHLITTLSFLTRLLYGTCLFTSSVADSSLHQDRLTINLSLKFFFHLSVQCRHLGFPSFFFGEAVTEVVQSTDIIGSSSIVLFFKKKEQAPWRVVSNVIISIAPWRFPIKVLKPFLKYVIITLCDLILRLSHFTFLGPLPKIYSALLGPPSKQCIVANKPWLL